MVSFFAARISQGEQMKRLFLFLILNCFLVSSCATDYPFCVITFYGARVTYGEGKHPGLDFGIKTGTPIIAASDGLVILITEPNYTELWRGGISVFILHGKHFKTFYAHMTKVFAEKGNPIKRGQLIGLSGASNDGSPHLHFGICSIAPNSCINYSKTFDPEEFWLGGKAQCFDPNKDYSSYSQKDLTLPIACGEYAKELVTRTQRKD